MFGNLQPLLAIVLAAIVLRERIVCSTVIVLSLGFAGVTLIAWSALTGPSAYGLGGALFALVASAGAAVGSVLIKRMGQPSAVLPVTAWILVVGSLPLFIGSVVIERSLRVVWTAEFMGLLLFLVSGWDGFYLSSMVWIGSQPRCGPFVSLLLSSFGVWTAGRRCVKWGKIWPARRTGYGSDRRCSHYW